MFCTSAMENQARCTVIKGIAPLTRHGNNLDSIEQKSNEQFLLPKRTQPPQLSSSAMGFPSSDRLLLPPILTFAHLAFPTKDYAGNTGKVSSDYYQTYPPLLNFSHMMNKPQQQQQLFHYRRQHPLIMSPRPLLPPTLMSTTPLVSKWKKPKFDFSIEALTSKDETTKNNNKTRSTIKQEEVELEKTSSFSPQEFKFSDHKLNFSDANMTPISIKNRGRPSADSIELLKQKSLQNPHRYSCPTCGRSFPRKKSLDTHILTHSDIKPYACDFPGCSRKFKQSGQLKTHLRLHTGEKPFQCTFPMCNSSFTHANRKCSKHPGYPLQRTTAPDINPPKLYEQLCSDKNNDITNVNKVKDWFQRQLAERESKSSQYKENKIPIHNENMTQTVPKRVLKQCNSTLNEENSKRYLSAVALVELQNENKNANTRKENYEKLFSINNIL